jgi:hypothetical protein
MDDHPRSEEQMNLLFADGWPKFITADQEVKEFIGRAREYFPALEIALLDEEDLVASGEGKGVGSSGPTCASNA